MDLNSRDENNAKNGDKNIQFLIGFLEVIIMLNINLKILDRYFYAPALKDRDILFYCCPSDCLHKLNVKT